jgi:hypothetical protein
MLSHDHLDVSDQVATSQCGWGNAVRVDQIGATGPPRAGQVPAPAPAAHAGLRPARNPASRPAQPQPPPPAQARRSTGIPGINPGPPWRSQSLYERRGRSTIKPNSWVMELARTAARSADSP